MTNLTPNDIASAIFWCGAQFGPNITPPQTESAGGKIVTHTPKPGSPERTKLENWLDTAIAICLAESGGNPAAKNSSSTASGLWQILVSAHASEIRDAQVYWATNRANGKTPSIFDPLVNTFVAARLYQQSGWHPWETYNNGDYKKHTGHGKAAYTYLTNPKNLKMQRQRFMQNMKDDKAFENFAATFSPIGGLVKLGDKFGINDAIGTVLKFLQEGALAVGVFLLGLILLIIGLWAIVGKTRAGKTIKSGVKAVIP